MKSLKNFGFWILVVEEYFLIHDIQHQEHPYNFCGIFVVTQIASGQ